MRGAVIVSVGGLPVACKASDESASLRNWSASAPILSACAVGGLSSVQIVRTSRSALGLRYQCYEVPGVYFAELRNLGGTDVLRVGETIPLVATSWMPTKKGLFGGMTFFVESLPGDHRYQVRPTLDARRGGKICHQGPVPGLPSFIVNDSELDSSGIHNVYNWMSFDCKYLVSAFHGYFFVQLELK
jgi:hypothetical protein